MNVFHEFAAAKINLTLRVLGKRPDGFHELESLVVFADGIGDVVRFLPAAEPAVTVGGPFGSAVLGRNIVEAVFAELSRVAPRLALGHVAIEKHIPVAAGLGGGSADAAAVLRAVQRANPEFADNIDWTAVSAAVGADVPVCLLSAPAIVSGRGERIHPLPAFDAVPAVIANALGPVTPRKTGAVFNRLAAADYGSGRRGDASANQLAAELHGARTVDAIARLQRFANDLEAPAAGLMPQVRQVLDALTGLPSARLVRMSGAGPSAFALFDSLADAQIAAAQLGAAKPDWWVVCTQLGSVSARG